MEFHSRSCFCWSSNACFSYILGSNSRQKIIVEDWEIGWRVKRELGSENLVTREEFAKLVKSLMDAENSEVKEIRKRAKELQETCSAAIAKGGSSDTNLDSFIRDISQGQAK